MTRDEYLMEVKEDVLGYLEEYGYTAEDVREHRDGLAEKLNDILWCEDSVTGNASGSYTCNTYKAEENLNHAWDLIVEVAQEFGIKPTISDGYEHGAEWWDVSIRCYLLGEAIEMALDELEKGA